MRVLFRSVDVGQSGPRNERIAQSPEKTVAVVVIEIIARRHAVRMGPRQGVGCYERARDFFLSIHAVGIARHGVDALGAVKRQGQRQQEFDVAPAPARSEEPTSELQSLMRTSYA